MPILALESSIIYGPIFSRRLGLSLGVNILSPRNKVCSFDCIYCHYGTTTVKTLHPQGVSFPPVSRILYAIERALHEYRNIEYLTFSGNGEPTLHPYFPVIFAEARQMRDHIRPDVKLALFSNATTLSQPSLVAALAHFDTPILKLDAGDDLTFSHINRPAPGVTLPDIVAGLRNVPNLILQSVFIDGVVSNAKDKAYEAWVATLADIRPQQVQIYSTDYPVPETGIERVPPYMLKRIAADMEQRVGIQAKAYWID